MRNLHGAAEGRSNGGCLSLFRAVMLMEKSFDMGTYEK